MKKSNGHKHGRNDLRGFESHRRDRGASDVRQGRAWRFAGRGIADPYEPHYRVTARMAALPGKHFRSVREPVRASHGRVD